MKSKIAKDDFGFLIGNCLMGQYSNPLKAASGISMATAEKWLPNSYIMSKFLIVNVRYQQFFAYWVSCSGSIQKGKDP